MRIFFRKTDRVLRVAKVHAKITGLSLQAAQNEVAFLAGYADLRELQNVTATGLHSPSPDDEDLAPDELRERRAYQATRLVEYRRVGGRNAIDEMTARAIVDDVRLGARTRSITGSAAVTLMRELEEVFSDVSVEEVWVLPVRAETTRAELAERSLQLTGMVPDRIVLLSVSPHDVTKRSDWAGIELLFQSIVPHVSAHRGTDADIGRIADRWPDVNIAAF
ncbi:hypothetical protein [Burkholderia vietnamiensis]|uniref:hypothetical protein n=1 Tax=Burkholderia vietnamiensis TaxID=60552 RepID=UPI001CF1745C|nr:hypothetical protein [Burkholderia vietnamiensis]MCA8228316.1 hypothetical protein [Burkholderia vietnamiensis]